MHRPTYRQTHTDKCTDKHNHTERQTYRQPNTDRRTGSQTPTDVQAAKHRQTDTHTDVQTDVQTDTHTDEHKDRQTDLIQKALHTGRLLDKQTRLRTHSRQTDKRTQFFHCFIVFRDLRNSEKSQKSENTYFSHKFNTSAF
jgi:phage I-like protein